MPAPRRLQSGTEIAAALVRDALQVLPDAIAIFDANDRLVFWNDNFADSTPDVFLWRSATDLRF